MFLPSVSAGSLSGARPPVPANGEGEFILIFFAQYIKDLSVVCSYHQE